MSLPHHARLFRVFVPPEPVGHPSDGHDVRRAIVIYVDRPLTAIRNELAGDVHRSPLVPLPIATMRAGVLVPVCSAENIRPSIAVHVDGSDALGVIGAQPMHEKRSLRHVSRSIASYFIELTVSDTRKDTEQRQNRTRTEQ